MKHLSYLNLVLTVIAINMVLITLAATGLFPTASAKDIGPRYVAVPVGADGTVNVNTSDRRKECRISCAAMAPDLHTYR